MRRARVWISATSCIVTAIIAVEQAQGSFTRQNASYTLICAEEDSRRKGGEKQHRRTEISRMLISKGRENITPRWSSHSGYPRLHKTILQGRAYNGGAQTWTGTATPSEGHWPLHEYTPQQSSRADKAGLGVQHGQAQLTYGRPPPKNTGLSKNLSRAVDADSHHSTREIKHIESVEAPGWLEKSTSLIGRQRSPEEQLEYPSTTAQHKHAAMYHRQRPTTELHALGEVDPQDTYGPRSWQHQKKTAHPNGVEITVYGGEALLSQEYDPSGIQKSPRQIPAALRSHYLAPPAAGAEVHAQPETSSLLLHSSEKRSQPQQEQRGARESTTTSRSSSLGPGISFERAGLLPVQHFFPAYEGNSRNRESSIFGVPSKEQSLLGHRQKVIPTRDSLLDGPVKKRAERRSYRKRDDVKAVGSIVATSRLAGSASAPSRKEPTFQQNIHTHALSPAQYVMSAAQELLPMSKSVLDLGVNDMHVLANMLYDLKATYYADRLEEGSKRREVQEGMFFSKLNRIQERQKLQRRENELKDEKKLKALEESLRLTKPLSAYHDALLHGGTHKRGRKSGSGIRFHKASDYNEWSRIPGEVDNKKAGRTALKSPKKNGNRRENKQKQMMALALIEREERGEEESGRASWFRRRRSSGTEEGETEEQTYFGAGSEKSDHRSDSIFSAWEYVASSPHNSDDPLFVVDGEDLHRPVQIREKREAGSARSEKKDTKDWLENHEKVEATTSVSSHVESRDHDAASAAQVESRGKNAHVEATEGAATGLHKNDTGQRHTIKNEQQQDIAKGSGTSDQLEEKRLHNVELFSTASGEFSAADVVGGFTEKALDEVLSIIIDDAGEQKVLAEKISDDSLRAYQRHSQSKGAQSGRLQEGFSAAPAGEQLARGDSTAQVSQGESVAVQAESDGLQMFQQLSTLLSDSTLQLSENPPIDERHIVDQDDQMATAEKRDIANDSLHLSKEFQVSQVSSADESERPLEAGQLASLQEEDRTTEGESLGGGEEGEDELVEDETESEVSSGIQSGSPEESEEEEEESSEDETLNEAGPTIFVDYFSEAPEEDTRSDDWESEPVISKTSTTDAATNRTDQSEFQETYSGSTHMLEEASAGWEPPGNIVEAETFNEEELFEKDFGERAVAPSDTYALRGSSGLSAEVLRNYGRPQSFDRRFDPSFEKPSSSPADISLLSPSRLSRFRARHFQNDAAENLELMGKHNGRFFDRSPQNRLAERAHQVLPSGRGESFFPSYRRLQFTSKKKSVLDRNTSARLEFVDNDHGSQFVNWRSIDGEKMIEKLWVSSMEEAERHQRKQVQREIESAFVNEFDAVRTKKKLLQALGVSTADEDDNEQQLAQRYYSAMQAVLHGPEEEVLTGQAFGRYVPSINQTFITDIRNRIIYGPWSVNWNRAINSRTQRVSVGSRRGAVSVGSSASSYVTTVNVNWGRVAVTFAVRPNDQAVKLGVLRGRYGVDIARSNRLRTSAVETVMRYVESATVVDQINRTYGQRIRVRRFSINYTRDFTLPSFDSPGRTPGLRQELGVNWGTVGISVGTDVPDSEYAISVGLRGYQFSVLRDFFQRLIQAQGNWGRGWQFELAAKIEDPISPVVFYQFGFGRLGRLYSTVGAGIGGDNTPMAIFQVQGDRSSVAFKALEQAGVRIFNIGFTVGRFTYSWDSVVNYDQITLPLSPISPILKALLHVTP